MATHRLGMVREWKTNSERRAPLIPDTVARLVDEGGLEIHVESSPHRVFSDAEYAAAGAQIVEGLSTCDLYLGIKEMPVARLKANRAHLFFSHTIKGQPYNMPLLERVLAEGCTLLDYELVCDDDGRRTIFFGEQAGQAGMINSLWTLGQRWRAKGRSSPLGQLRQAREYPSLDAARDALREAGRALRSGPIADIELPIVVGITGGGNVARGAEDLLDMLDPREVAPEDLQAALAQDDAAQTPVWKVRFTDQHFARARDGRETFDKVHYRANPRDYVGRFEDFLPALTVLVTGHYWEPPFPKMVTREWLRTAHAAESDPKLQVIGDVTCDPGGSVESTLRPTLPDDPCYVFDPQAGTAASGFEGPGLAVMAVDILPTEIARESSMAFDRYLAPSIRALVTADWNTPLADLAIPPMFRRAIIAHRGELAPDHKALADLIRG